MSENNNVALSKGENKEKKVEPMDTDCEQGTSTATTNKETRIEEDENEKVTIGSSSASTGATVVKLPGEVVEHSWKINMRVLISNLYMNTKRRLPGATYTTCMRNPFLCVNNHQRAILPNAPSFEMSRSLRSSLQNQNYQVFLMVLENLILQRVYPGEGILDRLVELLMVLVAKDTSVNEIQATFLYIKTLFETLLNVFPPCWTALRPYYLKFLAIKSSNRDNRDQQSAQKLLFYLELLEKTMPLCSEKEITTETEPIEEHSIDYSDEEENGLTEDEVLSRHIQDYDWISGVLCLDDFNGLTAPARLARLFDVFEMILKILEVDFLMWLEHNKLQQSEAEIFHEETAPFAVLVFGMTPTLRLTDIVRRLMRLYSQAAAKNLFEDRLSLLERYISLFFEVSNTSELEYEDGAVAYPKLGAQTRGIIVEFFKIFKSENPTHISTYIKTIPKLSQPYLRFMFAEQFLKLFYFSKKPTELPLKILEGFYNKQWLKYKQSSEIDEIDDEQLSRKDYLDIMLQALRDYCHWYGHPGFYNYLKTRKQVQPMQTYSNSPLATPVGVVNGAVGKVFMFDKMEKEAHTWSTRINSKVVISMPKVDLPLAKVEIPKLSQQYGSDIRYIRELRRIMRDEIVTTHKDLDISNWFKYFDELLGEDVAKKLNFFTETKKNIITEN